MDRIIALNLTPEGDNIFLKNNIMGVQNEALTCKPELFCTVLNYLKIYHDLMLQDKLIYDSVFHSLGLEEPARFSLGHLDMDFRHGYDEGALKNLSRNDRAIYATLPYDVIQELDWLDLDGTAYEWSKGDSGCDVNEMHVLVTPIPFDELMPGGPVVRCSIDLCQELLSHIKGHNYFAGNILSLIEGMQKCGAWLAKDKSKVDYIDGLSDKEKPYISALPLEIHMREFPCMTMDFGFFLRGLNAKGIYGTNEDIDRLKGYAPDLESIYHICEISSELAGDMFIKDFMKAIGETDEEATTDKVYFEIDWSEYYKELILAMAFQDIPIENLSARGDARAKDPLFALLGKIPKSRLTDINIYGYMVIGPAELLLFTSVGVVIGGNNVNFSTDNFYRVVLYSDLKKYLSEELVVDTSDAEVPEDNPFKLLNNSLDLSSYAMQFSDAFLTTPDGKGGMVKDLHKALTQWLQDELTTPQLFNTELDLNSGLRRYPDLYRSLHELIVWEHNTAYKHSHVGGPDAYTLGQVITCKIFMDCRLGRPVNVIWSDLVNRVLTACKQSVISKESPACSGNHFIVRTWELLYTLVILNTKYDFVVWTEDMYKDLDNILSNMKG